MKNNLILPRIIVKHRRIESIHTSLIQNIIQYIINCDCFAIQLKLKRLQSSTFSKHKIPSRKRLIVQTHGKTLSVPARRDRDDRHTQHFSRSFGVSEKLFSRARSPWGLFLSVTWNGVAMETKAWAGLILD